MAEYGTMAGCGGRAAAETVQLRFVHDLDGDSVGTRCEAAKGATYLAGATCRRAMSLRCLCRGQTRANVLP
jgi:hypothetical protein